MSDAMDEATQRRQHFERLELERREELNLAIWLVKQRADMFSDDPPEEETYLRDDEMVMIGSQRSALWAACGLLVAAKERHEDAAARYQHAWTAEHEENKAILFRRRQTAAHAAVTAAVADGGLVRPNTCSECSHEHNRIIAHHDSYDEDRRLDVRWLCPPCHGKHHAEHGSAA